MQNTIRIIICLGLILPFGTSAKAQLFGKKEKETEVKTKSLTLKTRLDSLSYALGIKYAVAAMGERLVDSVSSEAAMHGFKATLDKKEGLMTQQQAQEFLTSYAIKKQEQEAKKARKAGEDFLKANAKQPGVKTLSSGLQYKVLNSATGTAKPKASDRVKVHYHGTLIDGSVFDSSVNRGRPAQFPVNGVIKGWVEALQLMTPGDKWVLYIPSNLAYGARSAGSIPPHSTLIFEVELLEILK